MRRNCGIENGFTLIELLVVVCIIGILAALLLTGVSKANGFAQSATCKNHLHQMGLALQMYVDEHQGKYPFYHGMPDHALDAGVGADNTAFWWAKLLPYYPLKWTDPAYHCPGYKGVIEGSEQHTGGWTYPFGSYAYNARGASGVWTKTNDIVLGLGGKRPRRPSGTTSEDHSEGQIAVPSEMFAIGESRWKDGGDNPLDGGHDFMRCGATTLNRGPFAFDPARHGKNYNQLFCDGHVGAMSPWLLFNPTNTAAMWNFDHQPHPEFWPHL